MVGKEVQVALQILAHTLEHAVNFVSAHCLECKHEEWVDVEELPWRLRPHNGFLDSRMRVDEWCLDTTRTVCAPYSITLAYYVSLYRPPRVKSHENCKDGVECKSPSIRAEDYRTKHVVDKCSSAFLTPNMKALERIIEAGGIPVLYLEEAEECKKLKVERHRIGIEYTALSHVWANGLGNQDSNSLP